MKSNHWIEAHIHAYSFFGGVTRILVPDNLKTGVIKNTRAELVLNRSYHEMAEHYGTAIIPARPVKPKDKPNAEGTVKVLETWILAALRNRSSSLLKNSIKPSMKSLRNSMQSLSRKRKEAGYLHFLKKKRTSSCHYLLPRMKRCLVNCHHTT